MSLCDRGHHTAAILQAHPSIGLSLPSIHPCTKARYRDDCLRRATSPPSTEVTLLCSVCLWRHSKQWITATIKKETQINTHTLARTHLHCMKSQRRFHVLLQKCCRVTTGKKLLSFLFFRDTTQFVFKWVASWSLDCFYIGRFIFMTVFMKVVRCGQQRQQQS